MPQSGQRERGATIDSPIGTRWATTLRKLPAHRPEDGHEDDLSRHRANLPWGSADQPIGVVVSTSSRLSRSTLS